MTKATRPKPTVHRVGGLTIIDRTGEPFDAQEFIQALKDADYSHLPKLPRKWMGR